MFVHCHNNWLTLLLGDRHRYYLRRETPRLLCGNGVLLTAKCESILVGATDSIALCNILGCFTHAERVVHRRQFGIDKTPAERGIFQLHVATERRIRFTENKRRTAHTLY